MRKESELADILRSDYQIIIGKKWVTRYAYRFKHIPQLPVMSNKEAVQYAFDHVDLFAYFIFGARADYHDQKRQET